MTLRNMLRKKKMKDETENTNNVSTQQNQTEQEQSPLLDELGNEADENGTNADETQTTAEPKAAEVSAEEKLKADLAQANDKYLRLYAEFDNFRRRTSKERVELLQTAGKEVIVSLLPVLDDFERAIKAMEKAGDVNAVKEGVVLVQQKLKNILGGKGLKEMEAKGTAFDADVHEAITNIPAPTDDLKGKVVDELEKGYYLNDKVIRFAKVVVGS